MSNRDDKESLPLAAQALLAARLSGAQSTRLRAILIVDRSTGSDKYREKEPNLAPLRFDDYLKLMPSPAGD